MCTLCCILYRIVTFSILVYELMAHCEGHIFPDTRQAEFVRQLTHFEVAYPIRVTADGHYLTHSVHYRYRRSTSHVRRHSAEEDTLHYKITLDNSEVHLRLRRNDKFLAPGFVVERRRNLYKNVSDSFIWKSADNLCHFYGESIRHPRSRVAISTCDGLTGIIGLDHEDYFIEPIRGQNYSNDASHPHIVYKRSALPLEYGGYTSKTNKKDSHGSCGVKDDESFDKINYQRKRWERSSRSKTSNHRRKRSISAERNVETLIVVDKKMMDYYADHDVETYVLTVMNMVATLFHDVSLGNMVSVILVRLILLEEEDEKLKIDHHADNTLKSFCKWQKTINPKRDTDPNHHDVAVLLTRYNICTRMNEPCNTLGLAEVSGMCQPHRSCNINEDTGLALAFTVAHEMGHNFGMKHDSQHNGCQSRYGERQHVMAPHLNSDVSPLIWSNCSRNEITKFLDRDWGECLDDEPSDHEFQYPVLPPGAMYDADHQCRLQYGSEAEHCEGIESICSALWCKVNNRCLTRLEPPAEGTQCGKHKWCSSGKCSTMGERPDAINGAWGEWSEWSGCSRTCGAGVSYSERHCEHPAPSNGGRFCVGERKRYRVCNSEVCPEGSSSFRELQCASYNNKTYREQLYKWEPVSTPGFPCQLYCKPSGEFFSVMLSDTVLDGTPCRPGSRDMCINGKCMKVGCDWGIHSIAKEDRCGICHGDGSSCTTVKEEFVEKQGLGYVMATIIPKGARNIKVEEKEAAGNYIALKGEDGHYYLNGHWFIQWSGDYDVAGTTMHYRRSGNKETVYAPGPLKENLHIMLLFQTHNPGIVSEYTIPYQNATREPEFFWEFLDWTRCTVSCGGGKQRSSVFCAEKEAGIVDDMYCNTTGKPDDKLRDCNMHQCPARWWSGPWQHCSVTCGNLGIRRRTVICVRALGADEQIALHDLDCENHEKPADIEPCHNMQACPPGSLWKSGEWSNTCLGNPCGLQTRSVFCSDPNGNCNLELKPVSSRQCSNATCGIWNTGNWSQCSHSCGDGFRFRKITCEEGIACNFDDEPESIDSCNEVPCPTKSSFSTISGISTEFPVKILTTETPLSLNQSMPNVYTSQEYQPDTLNCNTENCTEYTITSSEEDINEDDYDNGKNNEDFADENEENSSNEDDDESHDEIESDDDDLFDEGYETTAINENEIEIHLNETHNESVFEWKENDKNKSDFTSKKDSNKIHDSVIKSTVNTSSKVENTINESFYPEKDDKNYWELGKVKESDHKKESDTEDILHKENENKKSDQKNESVYKNELDDKEKSDQQNEPNQKNESDQNKETGKENKLDQENSSGSKKKSEQNITNDYQNIVSTTTNNEFNDVSSKEPKEAVQYNKTDIIDKVFSNSTTNETAYEEDENTDYEYSEDNYDDIIDGTENFILTTTPEPEIETPVPSFKKSTKTNIKTIISNKKEENNVKNSKTNAATLNELKNNTEINRILDNKLLHIESIIISNETINKSETFPEINQNNSNIESKSKDNKEHPHRHHHGQIKDYGNEKDKTIHGQSFNPSYRNNHSNSDFQDTEKNDSENIYLHIETENEDIPSLYKDNSDIKIEIHKETENESSIMVNEHANNTNDDKLNQSQMVQVRNITEIMISEKPPDGDDILQLANNNSILISIDEKDFVPEEINSSDSGEHHIHFEKPLSHKPPLPTDKPEEQYGWKIGEWSKCSVNCGGGYRTRDVMCFDLWASDVVHPRFCNLTKKPNSRDICKEEPCLDWIISEFSECSVTCGHGSRIRDVSCPLPHRCRHSDKPLRHQPCHQIDCAGWVAGIWSQCSVSCGGGEQVRDITCRSHGLEKSEELCELSNKPEEIQECNVDDCPPEKNIKCINKLRGSVCQSFRHMCSERLFKPLCCQTCSKLSLQKRDTSVQISFLKQHNFT